MTIKRTLLTCLGLLLIAALACDLPLPDGTPTVEVTLAPEGSTPTDEATLTTQPTPKPWNCIGFEDLPLGIAYDVGNVFATSGMQITASDFQWGNGGWTSDGSAEVGTAGLAGGSGQEMIVGNIMLMFDFDGPATGLTLHFAEYGGNLNIDINGAFLNSADFANINGDVIGGASVSVVYGPSNDQGTLALTGTIDTFAVGGQELVIDDVCPSELVHGDLLMITTSLLEKESAFENTVNQYRNVLVDTEDLTARYIELDSDECLSTYGIKVNNPGDWQEVRDVLEEVIGIAEASCIMILGGPLVVPRPVVDACCNDAGDPFTVPSDAWYLDFDGDQIVDEGLSISRLPDLSYNSSAVVDALQTAIELHSTGGYTLDNEVRFTMIDYTTPPYGVCNTCDMDTFFTLMSTSDYIVFAGHGSPTLIASNDRVPKFSIDYMDSIDLQESHPVIIAYYPCSAGGLYPDGSSFAIEFMRAGAAAYVARTTTEGIPNYVADNFPVYIEAGMHIGPALFQSMREAVLIQGDRFKATAGHICLYGDPTLGRR